jgi:hypothetical protein
MLSFSVTKLEAYLVSSGAHGHCLRYPRYFGTTISSKNISHPNWVIYLFPTPPIKQKLGLQIDGRLKVATYLDQSNYLTNQEQVFGFALPSAASMNCAKMLGKNRFDEPNWHVLNFLHSILVCHILSSSGVALTRRVMCTTISVINLESNISSILKTCALFLKLLIDGLQRICEARNVIS